MLPCMLTSTYGHPIKPLPDACACVRACVCVCACVSAVTGETFRAGFRFLPLMVADIAPGVITQKYRAGGCKYLVPLVRSFTVMSMTGIGFT